MEVGTEPTVFALSQEAQRQPSSHLRPGEDDRRESPRVALDRIIATFQGASAMGRGDLSVGGALWEGAAAHATCDQVELTFQLGGDPEPLRLRAQVVRRRETAAGVALHLRFLDPPFEAERRIARYLDQCLEQVARWR